MSRRRKPILVVVVEANRTQCAVVKRVLEAEGDIAVTATAATADDALTAVTATRPHVVTVDLQIEGGGTEAISRIMRDSPRPVLVLSAAVQGVWSRRAVDALAAGAADVLPKPVRWDAAAQALLRDRVRALAGVTVHALTDTSPPAEAAAAPPAQALAPAPARPSELRIVAMAASTGGPHALAHVLAGLGGVDAAILVVQHIHPDFVPGFVSWLNGQSALSVKAGRAGERVKPGVVYVAPAGAHLRLGGGTVRLDPDPQRLHTPSADELFASVAASAGARAVGVLLTGMGADGAEGLLAMRRAGAVTIVQDEETSAVFGMPGAAIRKGAADHVLPLDAVAPAIRAALARAPAEKAAR